MKTDKSEWGEGPWQNEPDRVEWRVGELYCLVNRSADGGNLNGYVGVPPYHPWYNKEYDDLGVECHGGLTFSGDPVMWDYAPHCPAGYWIVGFDCGHNGDRLPIVEAILFSGGFPGSLIHNVYRDLAYVTDQVYTLVGQALGWNMMQSPPYLGLNVADDSARFDYPYLVGLAHVNRSEPITGDGQKMVEGYIKGLIPLGIIADWLYEHQEEVGLGGISDLHSRIMAFSLPERPKPDSGGWFIHLQNRG